MRNPIRLKNLSLRFLPYYALGLAILVFYPVRPEGLALGVGPVLFGAAIRSWGAGHLVKNDVLTLSGPYAHLRHPLYLGTIAVATGFALMVGGWLALGLLALVWPWFAMHYFPRKEKSESRRLEGLYGDAFRTYRASVPALWPRLRPYANLTGDIPGQRWSLSRYSENNELGTLLALVLGVFVFWLRASGRFG
ncbi:MAG: isoprenylcysteine carboxylmethyltransferase family protein [Myxococcota bacterium]